MSRGAGASGRLIGHATWLAGGAAGLCAEPGLPAFDPDPGGSTEFTRTFMPKTNLIARGTDPNISPGIRWLSATNETVYLGHDATVLNPPKLVEKLIGKNSHVKESSLRPPSSMFN